MATLYRIKDWERHFENNRTRELKAMSWVPLPNKHDGDGYTELLDHSEGPSHYGAWVAMVQVASRCDPRGTLLRDSKRPHTSATLSRMTRIPVAVVESAIVRLLSIGWLEAEVIEDECDTTIPQKGATKSQDAATLEPQFPALNGREWKGKKEGNGTEQNGTAFGDLPSLVLSVFAHYRTYHPRAYPSPTRTSKEWKLIAARLAEGYSVADLNQAIDGCHKCPHNLGQNERQQKYLHLDLIVRDGSQVSRFMDIATEQPKPVLSLKTQRTMQAAEDFIRERGGDPNAV